MRMGPLFGGFLSESISRLLKPLFSANPDIPQAIRAVPLS